MGVLTKKLTEILKNLTGVTFGNSTGAAPFAVKSSTMVNNLNAERINGLTQPELGRRYYGNIPAEKCLRVGLSSFQFTLAGFQGNTSSSVGLLAFIGYGAGTSVRDKSVWLIAPSKDSVRVYIGGASEGNCLYVKNLSTERPLYYSFILGYFSEMEISQVESIPSDATEISTIVTTTTTTLNTDNMQVADLQAKMGGYNGLRHWQLRCHRSAERRAA